MLKLRPGKLGPMAVKLPNPFAGGSEMLDALHGRHYDFRVLGLEFGVGIWECVKLPCWAPSLLPFAEGRETSDTLHSRHGHLPDAPGFSSQCR